MDIRWFQDFVTLAEVQNFTRAADLRNVTQPAFSRRIQALEQWIGAKLIDRAAFPTRLTPAGEEFRKVAVSLVTQIADARAAIGELPSKNHVRLALSYALASTRLPQWWTAWSDGGAVTCSLDVGNVHDTVSALSANSVDILIGFHHASHPIVLDKARCEQACLATERIRPYASIHALNAGRFAFPGSAPEPIPLLMHSPSSYFSRVVDTSIEQAAVPLYGYRAFESEMTEVLAELACQGMGVAWLPDSSFSGGRHQELAPVGDGNWDTEIAIIASRALANTRPVVGQIWSRILASSRESSPSP